jgi:hypothetical protein
MVKNSSTANEPVKWPPIGTVEASLARLSPGGRVATFWTTPVAPGPKTPTEVPREHGGGGEPAQAVEGAMRCTG